MRHYTPYGIAANPEASFQAKLESASPIEARKLHLSGDVIFDRVRVPPFFRVDLHPIELHGEMDVISSGHTGLAAHYKIKIKENGSLWGIQE